MIYVTSRSGISSPDEFLVIANLTAWNSCIAD